MYSSIVSFSFLADYASSPRFQNSIFMRGRSLVILLAPNEIPCGCDDEKCEKDNRCVIHVLGHHRDCRRHAEKW